MGWFDTLKSLFDTRSKKVDYSALQTDYLKAEAKRNGGTLYNQETLYQGLGGIVSAVSENTKRDAQEAAKKIGDTYNDIKDALDWTVPVLIGGGVLALVVISRR